MIEIISEIGEIRVHKLLIHHVTYIYSESISSTSDNQTGSYGANNDIHDIHNDHDIKKRAYDTLMLVIIIFSIICGTILIVVIVGAILFYHTKKLRVEEKKLQCEITAMKLQEMNKNAQLNKKAIARDIRSTSVVIKYKNSTSEKLENQHGDFECQYEGENVNESDNENIMNSEEMYNNDYNNNETCAARLDNGDICIDHGNNNPKTTNKNDVEPSDESSYSQPTTIKEGDTITELE